jgi:hypothetical protein
MIKVITEKGEWKEIQDISAYAETADADKVYLIKIKFDTNQFDYEEVSHLMQLTARTFADNGLKQIVIAEPKGIEFEIYELEKEKEEK